MIFDIYYDILKPLSADRINFQESRYDEQKTALFCYQPHREAGSQIRQDADDLLNLIIKPALDIYNLDVVRGDHRSEANQIDIDVIKSVQDAEICIADISLPNPNVYYEIGRRDETGKPLILLKSKSSDSLPVDIATKRYIEYDLDSRRGIGDAMQQLRNFVEPLAKADFERSSSGASLGEIASTLQLVLRKLDRLAEGTTTQTGGTAISPIIQNMPDGSDPKDVFKLAARQRNIPLMEQALDVIQVRMDKWAFFDYYVEVAASRGSDKAGNMLIQCASEFFDKSGITFKQKIEYLSSLVSYLGSKDREEEQIELVEELARRLEAISDGEDPNEVAKIYNQLNRLYYGIYVTKDDEKWLCKAVQMLEVAREYAPDKTFIIYNLATCYMYLDGHLDDAVECITRVLAMDAEGDGDDSSHLQTAYKIYRKADDPRINDAFERLKKVDPVKAELLRTQS